MPSETRLKSPASEIKTSRPAAGISDAIAKTGVYEMWSTSQPVRSGKNIPLMPEDTVYVKADEEHTFYVLGEVNRPGVFPKGQDMDVVRAIALAGGQTMDGAMTRVRVIRRVNGKSYMQEINVMQVLRGRETGGPPIESGDIVFVPRKGVAVFNYYVAQMTPSMNTVLLGATMYQIGHNK